ncbi:hypothetical protein AXF42_Ash021500 [Apostasia shenzhenica]|uniref:Uncharacterized protein n=1 Tax=Apostasia shenzhenica TaxID=1088818 RepID=A0A2H9ZVU2_9ASPA|nr:hypothetical protein AXF42_Ash021500 [Apostasia shenzhenica]
MEEAQVHNEDEKENIKVYTGEKLNSDEVLKKVDIEEIVLVYDSDAPKKIESLQANLNYLRKLKIGADKASFIDETLLHMKNR